MNRLSREKQEMVIQLLVEGNSIRSVERILGIHRDTIMRLAVKVGNACKRMLDARMSDLKLEHLQCDEIWTFCYKKERRVLANEDSTEIGDQFLFIALDEATKLIPMFLLGKRTSENTYQFMDELARRLRGFSPTGDPLEPVSMAEMEANYYRPQISTDGFTPYPGAVEEAFSGCADHGVLIKNYRESEQPGRYGPPEMAAAERRPMSPHLDPYSICTSHVERNNLTIRLFMRRFTRLTLGFSKKLDNLSAAVALYIAHFNFCRHHRTIECTPAVAAGIADHKWTIAELLDNAGV